MQAVPLRRCSTRAVLAAQLTCELLRCQDVAPARRMVSDCEAKVLFLGVLRTVDVEQASLKIQITEVQICRPAL